MRWPFGLITGPEITCCNWQVEGVLRMLVNNIVQGAVPEELVIYGGRGKAARNWECFDGIVEALRSMNPDDTLLIQSGKPVGVVRTFEHSPRVLIANSNLVPMWSNDTVFNDLEARGLIMYGQMTAGSWIYIGQQGILQGTYETLAAAGCKPGTLFVSAGLGNMGGAQAPAAKMCGATALIAEINPAKIQRCHEEGLIDRVCQDIAEAVHVAQEAAQAHKAMAIAVQINAIDLLRHLHKYGVRVDVLTDQTAAHDPRYGYYPHELTFDQANELRAANPAAYEELSLESMALHVRLLLELQKRGTTTFDYGNGIRFHAKDQGVAHAYDIKGFVPLYVRPLFCQGRGPFRVASLMGDPHDIEVIDQIILRLFPDNQLLVNWIEKVRRTFDLSKQPGLPARVCWLGLGERFRAVEAIWQAVNSHTLSGPIVVGRDHLDCGSVASPGRETEGMKDGSDAIADWPLLNALLNTASGATWVSIHNGGGVGIGKATHAGQCFVITPDGDCITRAKRLFTNDPLIGVMRHADAGYAEARATLDEHHIDLPMDDLVG